MIVPKLEPSSFDIPFPEMAPGPIHGSAFQVTPKIVAFFFSLPNKTDQKGWAPSKRVAQHRPTSFPASNPWPTQNPLSSSLPASDRVPIDSRTRRGGHRGLRLHGVGAAEPRGEHGSGLRPGAGDRSLRKTPGARPRALRIPADPADASRACALRGPRARELLPWAEMKIL